MKQDRVQELRLQARRWALFAAVLVVAFVMIALGTLLGAGLSLSDDGAPLDPNESGDLLLLLPAVLSALLLASALGCGLLAWSNARRAEALSEESLEERLADWQAPED